MGEFDFTGELEKLDDWKMPEMRGGARPFPRRPGGPLCRDVQLPPHAHRSRRGRLSWSTHTRGLARPGLR